MKVIIPAITFVAFYLLLYNAQTAFCGQVPYWKDYATCVDFFKGISVERMVAADGRLYVSAKLPVERDSYKSRFYVVNTLDLSVTDVSDKVLDNPKSEVYNMEVDEEAKSIHIDYYHEKDRYYAYELDKYKPDIYDLIREDTPPSEEDRAYEKDIDTVYSLDVNGRSSPSVECDDREFNQIFIGYFHGNIHQYFLKEKQYRITYEVSSEYCWPTSCVLATDFVFFGTRCDGLIVVDRRSGDWKRYLDKARDESAKYVFCTDEIQELAVYENNLYIGGRGLYVIDIKKIKSDERRWHSPGERYPLGEFH